jgi:RsiW-degrading membrane proteinase PrsW (M82 family)
LIYIAAIVPVVFIASLFYFLDRNREPVKVVIWAFLLGMVSVLLLLFILMFNPIPRPPLDGRFVSSFVVSFYHAGFYEELAKYLVFMIGLSSHRHFDEWYDGILYGVMIGLGFGFVENIQYFDRYLTEMGSRIVIVRSLFSMPMHALLGGVMGFYIGKAKFTPRRHKVVSFLLLALLFPVLLHGLFDFVIFIYSLNMKLLAIPIVLFMWIRVLSMKRISQKGLN